VDGIGRFVQRECLNVAERTIAIVGPNEAGKSTLLRAIVAAADRGSLETLRNRDRTVDPMVQFLYVLDDDDRSVLSVRKSLSDCTQLIAKSCLGKDGNPATTWEFQPVPTRDRTNWEALHGWLSGKLDDDEQDIFERVIGILAKPVTTLPAESIKELRLAQEYLVEHYSDDLQMIEMFGAVVEEETLPSPGQHAINLLSGRAPSFFLFGAEDRELKSFYPLAELSAPSQALQNLATFAGVELGSIVEWLANGQRPRASAHIDQATRRLRDRFAEEWNQSKVFPVLQLDNTGLFLHVTTEDEATYTDIDSRSDGLRMFIALRCFLGAASDNPKPILLIDEVEQHLHYDAQRDLVAVLANQQLAQKVIYTTHSIGSLPLDHGGSVRSVVRVPDTERSNIVNDVWQPGIGIVPMLRAMGSTLLLTSAVSQAVLCEGATETLLLSEILSDADPGSPAVRVLPGLSGLTDSQMSDLDLSAGRCVCLLDGDQGGRNLKARLIAAGFPEERIRTLDHHFGAGATIEDLVEPSLFREAFIKVHQEWRSVTLATDFDTAKTGRFALMCEGIPDKQEPSKPSLAARVREMAAGYDNPARRISDPAKNAELKELSQWIQSELNTRLKLKTEAVPSLETN
jgi:predicted ATP-dependent endonuclease of OLD family